jgi:hypothetical protein
MSEYEMMGLNEKIVVTMEINGMGLAVEQCGAIIHVSGGFEMGLVG